MLTLLTKAHAWWTLHEERGATLVEYALLVVLIAIVALVAITFAGEQVSDTFSNIGETLEDELG